MTEMKKSDLPNCSDLNALFVIKNTDGRDSSFIINGILPTDLTIELKTIIHDYIQKSRLTLSNSYWYAQSVTMPSEDSTSGARTKKEDLSKRTNRRGNYNHG